MLWFIFITFWYDKVSIKINKSISYEQAPLLLFKMSSVTLVNFTATSQSASHSYHIIKCSLCLVLLQYAPYLKLFGSINLIAKMLGCFLMVFNMKNIVNPKLLAEIDFFKNNFG